MGKLFRSIDVKIQYARIALNKINMPHIGDIVMYNNTECALIQGVRKPYWDLLPLTKENLAKPKREIYYSIHEQDFMMKPLWKRFFFSFKSTYHFYMGCWYSIDMMKTGRISFIQTY